MSLQNNKYHQLKRKYKDILTDFEACLQKQRYEENTIRQFINYLAFFWEWKTLQKLYLVEYSDILSFIAFCQREGDHPRLINRRLAAIRKYYSYLQSSDKTIKNPASGLYLKSKRRGIPKDLLEKEDMNKLYENYQAYDLRTARNKVILSFLINQALTTDELRRLEPVHIRLKAGKIEMPGGKHSNGRILKLEPHQIIELHEYITEIRPAILKAIKNTQDWPGRLACRSISAGRKAEKPDIKKLESQLFMSINGGSNLKNSLYHLCNALKLINPDVKDLKQIRQSVITFWLKNEDIRLVQYKAGHRYVSTTERYQSNNLEDLQEALNQHHPLK
jgi:integrase/recombinase XerD